MTTNEGDGVVRHAADGLAVLSAVTSTTRAGGGVLPRGFDLRTSLLEGDRDGDAFDDTFAVATREPKDTSPALSIPDTVDGARKTALPNSSSESAGGTISSQPPNSSKMGSATGLSRLSESPNLAVDPDDAPATVIAPAKLRRGLYG